MISGAASGAISAALILLGFQLLAGPPAALPRAGHPGFDPDFLEAEPPRPQQRRASPPAVPPEHTAPADLSPSEPFCLPSEDCEEPPARAPPSAGAEISAGTLAGVLSLGATALGGQRVRRRLRGKQAPTHREAATQTELSQRSSGSQTHWGFQERAIATQTTPFDSPTASTGSVGGSGGGDSPVKRVQQQQHGRRA
jgi:hypothetical protein